MKVPPFSESKTPPFKKEIDTLTCFEYIESYYNSYRPHQSNNQMAPNEKERIFYE